MSVTFVCESTGMLREDATQEDAVRSMLLIDSIGNIGTEQVLDHLVQLVNGSTRASPSSRRAAIQALRKHNCTRVQPDMLSICEIE